MNFSSILSKRRNREPKEENVTLGPATRDGEIVFGVAHIFASFNDTFIHIKAIITTDEVFLRNPLDDNVVPVVEELQRRLPMTFGDGEGEDEADQTDERTGKYPFRFQTKLEI